MEDFDIFSLTIILEFCVLFIYWQVNNQSETPDTVQYCKLSIDIPCNCEYVFIVSLTDFFVKLSEYSLLLLSDMNAQELINAIKFVLGLPSTRKTMLIIKITCIASTSRLL